jgi:hypothetical protein
LNPLKLNVDSLHQGSAYLPALSNPAPANDCSQSVTCPWTADNRAGDSSPAAPAVKRKILDLGGNDLQDYLVVGLQLYCNSGE